MARFRAWIEGRYGNQASRMGDDGILAELTAAKVGVYVLGEINDKGEDEFRVYATRGRRDGIGRTEQHVCLGRITLTPEGIVTFLPEVA